MYLLRQAGSLRCCLHFLISAVLGAEGNVVANARAEEKCLLGNKSDVLAQGLNWIVADIAAVNQYRTFTRVINAWDQADERALAGTRGTNNRKACPSRNSEIDAREYLAAGRIAKSQATELNVSINRRDLL